MARPLTKMVYLQGKQDTAGLAKLRAQKVERLARKMKDTQSAAIRKMIDAYNVDNYSNE